MDEYTSKKRMDSWEGESRRKPPLRKDQQPCFADTEPTQFNVAFSDLNFALTRAVDAEPASIFTQTVFFFQ